MITYKDVVRSALAYCRTQCQAKRHHGTRKRLKLQCTCCVGGIFLRMPLNVHKGMSEDEAAEHCAKEGDAALKSMQHDFDMSERYATLNLKTSGKKNSGSS